MFEPKRGKNKHYIHRAMFEVERADASVAQGFLLYAGRKSITSATPLTRAESLSKTLEAFEPCSRLSPPSLLDLFQSSTHLFHSCFQNRAAANSCNPATPPPMLKPQSITAISMTTTSYIRPLHNFPAAQHRPAHCNNICLHYGGVKF